MKSRWLGPTLVAVMWITAAVIYGRLPDRIPTHWNAAGQVDGYAGRLEGAFLSPAIATATLALMYVLRRIDPRRDNVRRFAGEWVLIVNLIILFLAFLQGATMAYALGVEMDVTGVTLAAAGLMMAVLGNFMPRIRSNWYMGIRTPWTLDNERVWRATHRVGGVTFVIGGLGIFAAAWLPEQARTWVMTASIAFAAGIPLVYSYVAYRRDAAGKPL
ncbi:MAG TPA: SdpI family protein [Longimicrobium sp.]|nr:SdpI family protein [Longimicrobium sp.]